MFEAGLNKILGYLELCKKYNYKNLIFSFVGAVSSKRNGTLKKLAYAAKCDEHTVFFSKRRKNSSLCARHATV